MEKLKITFLALLFSTTLSACNQNIVASEPIENIEKNSNHTTETTTLPEYKNENQSSAIEDGIESPITEEIEQFLYHEVPELDNYAEYISNQSAGEANLTIRIDTTPIDIYKNGESSEYLGKYYAIYVGESRDSHNVRWDSFYVSENLDNVLWEDVIRAKDSEFDMYTLEEWRNSSHYRDWLK
ncbi:hypothetical protein [Lacrimispora sp.]|uniref:hypothetical protein n=1 Tax=Lacrimispora sp. TaxID=2719234 RepID=UPI00289FE91F|nr:hypothetical protein [Lacrimispora sp.]